MKCFSNEVKKLQKQLEKFFWIGLDLLSINIAFILSVILRFGKDWAEYLYTYKATLIYLTLLYLIFSLIFNLYNRMWIYTSINSLVMVILTITCAVAACVMYFNIVREISFPRTVQALTWFIGISLIGGNKLLWRLYWEKRTPFKRRGERILIVGAGDAGNIVCREIDKRKDLGILVGFVDDDTAKIGKIIHNKKVLGPIEKINQIIDKEKVGMVVITIPSAKGSEIRRIINKINRKNIKIKIMPGLYELLGDEVSVSRIRDVQMEDLLNRESINLNIKKISGYIKGKKIMVTGGAGSIGKELSLQVCKFSPEELIILDHNENGVFYIEREIRKKYPKLKIHSIIADIRNREKMEKVFKNFQPEVVFHAAAHKHVPMMEYHPDEAVSNNIIGTKNLAELADKYGVNNFVMISTDKAINPTSVMGASKQVAEMIIKMYGRKSKTNFVAVRFGNVLASNGSIVPIFKKQIAEGGPITVTDNEMKRYFMTISEASQLVIQAGGLGIGEEVFILEMGEPLKIVDLARNLIKLSGFAPDEDIKIKFTGIRPGEKLFEELMTEKERNRVPGESGHEKIFIAQTEDVRGDKLEKDIAELEVLAKDLDNEGIVRKLQEIVPTYKPNRGMLKK